MRWRFWRRDRPGRSEPGAGRPDAPYHRSEGRRSWATLRVLPVTVELTPPAVNLVLRPPSIAGTRPMLRNLVPLAHPPAAAPVGRVSGLARAHAPTPAERSGADVGEPKVGQQREPREPSLSSAEIESLPHAVRTLAVIESSAVPAETLIRAVDEYVFEPRAPAEPMRGDAGTRRMMDRLTSTDGAERELILAASLRSMASPDNGPAWTDDEAPHAPTRAADADTAPEPSRRRLQRHSLAQSRRLGLLPDAATLKGLAPEDDATVDDSQEEAPDRDTDGGAGDDDPEPEPANDVLVTEPVTPTRLVHPPAVSRPALFGQADEESTPVRRADEGRVDTDAGSPVDPSPPNQEELGVWRADDVPPSPSTAVAEPHERPTEGLPRLFTPTGPSTPNVVPATDAPRSADEHSWSGDSSPQPPPNEPPASRVPRSPTESAPHARLTHPAMNTPDRPLAANQAPPQQHWTPSAGPPADNPPPARDSPHIDLAPPPMPVPEAVVQPGRPLVRPRQRSDADEQPIGFPSGAPTVQPVMPVYRAALGPLPPPIRETVPTPESSTGAGRVRVAVPALVADTFQTTFGVDVRGIPVHRGPEVTHLARGHMARAFAQAGEVYLPDEEGDPFSDSTRALLAHELVHAVQQRVLGPQVPPEDSAEGERLEAAAVATERWFRGESMVAPELVHRPSSVSSSEEIADYTERVRDEMARLAETTSQQVQRVGDENRQAVLDLLNRDTTTTRSGEPELTANESAAAASAGDLVSWSILEAMRDLPGPAPAKPTESVEPANRGTTADVITGIQSIQARISEVDSALAELEGRLAGTASDLVDHQKLDELAGRLYRHIRSRFRNELIVDRERAGTLTDFR